MLTPWGQRCVFCFVHCCVPSAQNSTWHVICIYFSTGSLEIRARGQIYEPILSGSKREGGMEVSQERGKAKPESAQPNETWFESIERQQAECPGCYPPAPLAGQGPLPRANWPLYPSFSKQPLWVHWVISGHRAAETRFGDWSHPQPRQCEATDHHSDSMPHSNGFTTTESPRVITKATPDREWDKCPRQTDPGPCGL